MGGKSGGGAKQQVTAYYASVHYGVSHPVDEVLEFHYGEKLLWSGSVTSNQSIAINREDLFGGEKVEGGFFGIIDVMLGSPDQLVSTPLAEGLARNGATETADRARVPGYRGLFTFYVHGTQTFDFDLSDLGGGFLGNFAKRFFGRFTKHGANIGHNTAIIKAFWTKVRRASKGCPFDPVIWVNGMELANPAAIIYECLINPVWSMSGSPSSLDTDSFAAAAATLRAEGFGLAIFWNQQESVEDFIGTVLNHIDGSLALDPFTGKFRLKLIRADYDPDTLPVFNESNATLTSFDRRGWGETINEINVAWTNPANEKQETVTVHDTANISLQGGTIISETRDFTGIRTAELALRVATRELRSTASSLATASLEANRDAWRLLPGDPIALQWGAYGYERIVMRATDVDYGAPGDSTITVKLIEDVFGMPDTSVVSSGGTEWVDPAIDPVPLVHEYVTSIPYYVLTQAQGENAAEGVPKTSDYAITLGTHPLSGVFGYVIAVEQADATGAVGWMPTTSAEPAMRGTLPAAMAPEVESLIASLENVSQGGALVEGSLLWIGPVDQTGELALITAVDATGYTVTRGVLDTVPGDWPEGTAVWELGDSSVGVSGIERSVGETATVRLLTQTSKGRLALGSAADVSDVMSGRLHRPYRPANLRASGSLWPDSSVWPDYPVEITWSTRNRLEETALINAWDDGSVTAEAGTDYRVLVEAIQEDGSVDGVVEDTTLAGESYDLAEAAVPAALAGSPFIRVTVTARRDGLESWQSPSVTFRGPFRAPDQLRAYYEGENRLTEGGDYRVLEDDDIRILES